MLILLRCICIKWQWVIYLKLITWKPKAILCEQFICLLAFTLGQIYFRLYTKSLKQWLDMAIYIRESRKEDDPLRIRSFPTKAMMVCTQQALYQLTRCSLFQLMHGPKAHISQINISFWHRMIGIRLTVAMFCKKFSF